MSRFRITRFEATLGLGLVLFICIVLTLSISIFHPAGDFGTVLSYTEVIGWGVVYLFGLAWTSFMVENAASRIEGQSFPDDVSNRRPWNPLDPASRFYGLWPGLLCFLLLAVTASVSLGIAEAQPWAAANQSSSILLRAWSGISPASLKQFAVGAGALSLLSLAAVVAQNKRLRQSLSVLAAYSLLFGLIYFLAHLQLGSSNANEYYLPAGGGNDSVKASSVKVQKVVRKKYVINPYSSILFAAPPPIDQIDVKLIAETANQYKAGQGDGDLGDGEGEGGGFGAGKAGGKTRFFRLRHADKNWDKNFGIGGDANLLADYGRRHYPKSPDKVAKESESIDCNGLKGYLAKASPPLVYIGGVGSFSPSNEEKKILKEYLIDKHGMILGDCLGPGGFHGSFINVMNEITGVTPVEIPRDDLIHKRPYDLPLFPFVVAHARPVPLGWKVDGRWVAYYHPGALSDAWRDDRAGIKKDVAELCYLLGHNILYYSQKEYGRWLKSQQQQP